MIKTQIVIFNQSNYGEFHSSLVSTVTIILNERRFILDEAFVGRIRYSLRSVDQVTCGQEKEKKSYVQLVLSFLTYSTILQNQTCERDRIMAGAYLASVFKRPYQTVSPSLLDKLVVLTLP